MRFEPAPGDALPPPVVAPAAILWPVVVPVLVRSPVLQRVGQVYKPMRRRRGPNHSRRRRRKVLPNPALAVRLEQDQQQLEQACLRHQPPALVSKKYFSGRWSSPRLVQSQERNTGHVPPTMSRVMPCPRTVHGLFRGEGRVHRAFASGRQDTAGLGRRAW